MTSKSKAIKAIEKAWEIINETEQTFLARTFIQQ